jgi:hypothetical protein
MGSFGGSIKSNPDRERLQGKLAALTAVACELHHRSIKKAARFARDSSLEGTGFEPSVPREASAFSSPVRADSSGGGKSSGANMSRSRNLDRMTRYQWFESVSLLR